MRVKLKSINYQKHHALLLDKVYDVLGIECDDLRIIDENGNPYLFPADAFDIVDNNMPIDWITEIGSDGERYSYPPELNQPGFFEKYFDGDIEIVRQFNNLKKSHHM